MIVWFILSFIALVIYETNPLVSWVLIGVLFLHTCVYTKIVERFSKDFINREAGTKKEGD